MKVPGVLVIIASGLAVLIGLDGCSLYEIFTGADIEKIIVPQPATVIRAKDAVTLSSEMTRIVDQAASKHGFYRCKPPGLSGETQSVKTLAFYKDNLSQPSRGLTVYVSVIKQNQQSLSEVVIDGEDLSSGEINEVTTAIVERFRKEIPGINFKVEKNVTYGRF